jgi:hypothetical protein
MNKRCLVQTFLLALGTILLLASPESWAFEESQAAEPNRYAGISQRKHGVGNSTVVMTGRYLGARNSYDIPTFLSCSPDPSSCPRDPTDPETARDSLDQLVLNFIQDSGVSPATKDYIVLDIEKPILLQLLGTYIDTELRPNGTPRRRPCTELAQEYEIPEFAWLTPRQRGELAARLGKPLPTLCRDETVFLALVDAIKTRIEVVRRHLPNARLALYGTITPFALKPDRYATRERTNRNQHWSLEGYREAGRLGMYDQLDYVSPLLFQKHDPAVDSRWLLWIEANTQTAIQGARSLRRSDGSQLRLFPTLWHKGLTEGGWEPAEGTALAMQIEMLRAEGVEQYYFWNPDGGAWEYAAGLFGPDGRGGLLDGFELYFGPGGLHYWMFEVGGVLDVWESNYGAVDWVYDRLLGRCGYLFGKGDILDKVESLLDAVYGTGSAARALRRTGC